MEYNLCRYWFRNYDGWPGQLVAAKALLDQNSTPTEDEIREWMAGNLCRCTGYYQIVESIVAAAAAIGGE